jgi:hypothetical protein
MNYAMDHQAFKLRADRLIKARQDRVVAEMHKLDPALPRNGSAFHLAHNWHACQRQKGHVSRKIAWLMKSYYEYQTKVNGIVSRHWDRVYQDWKRQA